MAPVSGQDDHTLVIVRLTPNARQDGIDGIKTLADGKQVLGVRVRAIPEDGAANRALETVIAKACKLARSRVAVVAGLTSRIKTVRIEGETDAIIRKLVG